LVAGISITPSSDQDEPRLLTASEFVSLMNHARKSLNVDGTISDGDIEAVFRSIGKSKDGFLTSSEFANFFKV
jgi:Ca2+-binding EF-hand superfamily protein